MLRSRPEQLKLGIVNSRLYKAIRVAAQCGHSNRGVMRPVQSRRNKAT